MLTPEKAIWTAKQAARDLGAKQTVKNWGCFSFYKSAMPLKGGLTLHNIAVKVILKNSFPGVAEFAPGLLLEWVTRK